MYAFAWTLVLLGSTAAQLQAQAYVRALTPLTPGVAHLTSIALSRDGQVLVGSVWAGSRPYAVRVSPETGVERLEPSGALYSDAQAIDVSSNGQSVVGWAELATNTVAWRWTSPNGMTPLGDLPGGAVESNPRAVSGDGQTVVGESVSAVGREAFRWHASTGMVSLNTLGSLGTRSWAQDVSADGTVIVGGISGSGPARCFYWTAAAGATLMTTEGLAGGEDLHGCVAGISCDGRVVSGSEFSTGIGLPFVWTVDEGLRELGPLPRSLYGATVTAMDSRGTVLTGYGWNEFNWNLGGDSVQPFLWTATAGFTTLKQHLTFHGATGLEGWRLRRPTGLSGDGNTVIGEGIGSEPEQVGSWMAFLALGI